MAHSRIIQLRTTRMTEENDYECMTADDFCSFENLFIGTIAERVNDDCERREDFDELIEDFQNVLGAGFENHFSWEYADDDSAAMPEAYIVFKSTFKGTYFQNRHTSFLELAGNTSLDNFMDQSYIGQLNKAICDKFDIYIAEGALEMQPLDTFIRSLPNGEEAKYWLWATLNYRH